MRLISQDGMIDVPYEKAILGICDQNNGQEYVIYAYQENPRPLFLATYSTNDKALKVMEMLRKQYQAFTSSKILFDGASCLLFRYATNEEIEEFKADFRQQFIFQFPDDLEVEV